MKMIQVSDYRLARFLQASGIDFLGSTRDPSNRVYFHFTDDIETRNLIEDYRYGNPPVPIHALETAEPRLKNVIFSREFPGG